MGPRATYAQRVYTQLVIYAAEDFEAEDLSDAPVALASARLIPLLRPDVAPNATVCAMYAIADAALIALSDPTLPQESRAVIETLLEWTDDIDEAWAVHQLEPPAIAGQLSASIDDDPDAPEDE